ncbi:hypothetical protein SAMN04489712_10422 [Thermomonospora echinospora]|uniref:Uncharacterized protein n=1 Tax=Thermomonospora echinospora TaxID=1992 RepID=A0A1H5YHS8_9ACTN|nr:hypothetical protein [Thermomonospora echinospora]SEG23651.1 hypothetical protein SAMN04489712_10422 [Thermomonospora echinospora]
MNVSTAWFTGLLDDAAVFPPGLMPLPDAVRAHARHTASPYAALVGPLVIAAPALPKLADLLITPPSGRLDVAVTFPDGPGRLVPVLAAAAALPVRVCAVEVAVPSGMEPSAFLAELDRAQAAVAGAEVFVEIPRDGRRPELIAACATTGRRAKFRTGGVTADLYPDEAELAAAVCAAVRADVPFKATAGLHHAVRNTDPGTGFEQHGFLNLLLAVEAALDGGGEADLVGVLAERDGAKLAARLEDRDARAEAVRARFLSFGTCSITEPLAELAALGLVPASFTGHRGATP